MIVTDLISALRKGKELKNKETFKNLQSLTNVFAALVAFAVAAVKLFGYEIPITDEEIITLSGGIASLVFVGNSVITLATSKSVGIGDGDKETDSDKGN